VHQVGFIYKFQVRFAISCLEVIDHQLMIGEDTRLLFIFL